MSENNCLIIAPSCAFIVREGTHKVSEHVWCFPKESNLSSRVARGLKRIAIDLHLPGYDMFFPWRSVVKQSGYVVILDTLHAPVYASYIHKRWPRVKVIIWYSNPVSKTLSPDQFDRSYCDLWSFDEDDCDAYDLKYNPQFYAAPYKVARCEPTWDLLFVGQDKGRLEDLLKLKECCDAVDISVELKVVRGRISSTVSDSSFKYSAPVPYHELFCDLYPRSRAIIDIQQEGQRGITLRPLEAAWIGIKLITNNPYVRNYEFYRESNILVLNRFTKAADIKHFLESPYESVPAETLEMYSTESWISRFVLDNHFKGATWL